MAIKRHKYSDFFDLDTNNIIYFYCVVFGANWC
jgi:hypothetical protein